MSRPTRNEQRKEAVARMKFLKIFPETVRQFMAEGLVSCSLGPLAACYWLDDEQKAAVAKFEKKSGGLVYHVIRNNTEFGVLDSYLYVSKTREEWPDDRADLTRGIAFVYVNAVGAPLYSEFGTIGIKLGPAAGLLRTQ